MEITKIYYKRVMAPKRDKKGNVLSHMHPISTYCFAETNLDFVVIGMSWCHPKNKFNKRTGREASFGRVKAYIKSNFDEAYKKHVYVVKKADIPNILKLIEAKGSKEDE